MVGKVKKGSEAIFLVLIVLAILVVINIIANIFHTQIDLTGDKRFTLTDATVKLLEEQDEPILIKVLLDGDFPSGFKRLSNSTEEMLQKFNNINGYIDYDFEDPLNGSVDDINARTQELAKDGVMPTDLSFREGDEMTRKLIYPWAIISYRQRRILVNLLEEENPNLSKEEILNNSVSLLEYKFVDAIQKLMLTEKPNILFTTGNGELRDEQMAALFKGLRSFYNTGRLSLDSVVQIKPELDLLVVAGPKAPISLKNQFKIDQYVMNGGKVIWLTEKMNVSLDSISRNKFYVPDLFNTELDDLFFKYGVRVQPNLVLDLECSKIPQVIGQQGGKAQTKLFNWYYHPLIASRSNHPIVKNIDRVNMFFPNTIDTIKTNGNLKKTVLLESSDYSRFQMLPMRLNFEILRYEPDASKFDKGPQPVAVLVEGEFESFFKNRVSQESLATLEKIGSTFKENSKPTKQLFVSDADFTKNIFDPSSNRHSGIGFNNWEKQLYLGNSDFILNSIEYMLDQNGVLEARSKEVKLRLLNTVKAKEERTKWQLINIVLPLVLLILFGLIFQFIRKRKYAS